MKEYVCMFVQLSYMFCVLNPMHLKMYILGDLPGCPGEGNGNPLQNSCLENSMDRGAWWAVVHAVTKNWTQLSN